MIQTPLVSIGLPVYNGEKYVAKAIESALSQTHENIELIISDNGSTDNTREIAESYAQQDKRVRVLHADEIDRESSESLKTYVNRAAANFIKVLEYSRGSRFCWLAHDNQINKDFVRLTLPYTYEFGGAIGSCATLDLLTNEARELRGIGSPNEKSHRINQIRDLVNTRRKGSPVAFYGLFKKSSLYRAAIDVLKRKGFDWSDLYIVAKVISSDGFRFFDTNEPVLLFGYEGEYTEKPFDGIATRDEELHRRIARLKAEIILRNPLSYLRALTSEHTERIRWHYRV